MTLKIRPELHQALIDNLTYADELANAFVNLQSAGITLESHPAPYKDIIAAPYNATSLANAFIQLKAAGIALSKDEPLCQAVIKNASYAKNLANAFAKLQAAGISLETHPLFYETLIKYPFCANSLTDAFIKLESADITLKTHLALYQAVIKYPLNADELADTFIQLKAAGITLAKHESLYHLIYAQCKNRDALISITNCIEKIRELGLLTLDNLDMIEQMLKSSNIALNLFTWLDSNKFTATNHGYLYQAIFSGKDPFILTPYYLTKLQLNIGQYLKTHTLCQSDAADYAVQTEEIKAIIDKVLEMKHLLTRGPISKSPSTQELECILQRIITDDISTINLRFDEALGYIMQFGTEPEIYLS